MHARSCAGVDCRGKKRVVVEKRGPHPARCILQLQIHQDLPHGTMGKG